MTAFIMLCSSGVKSLVAVLSFFLLALAARADNIEIKSAAVTLHEDGYAVDADMEISLTPPLEDILNKGVVLNFLLEFELIRPRWYWLNEKLVSHSQPYKLAYNALTRQYRISLGTIYQNFETLSEALRFISRPRNILVADKSLLQPGTTYSAALRMRLDVSQLPRPFQISVLGSREWNLSSDWFRFSVTP
jgi:uncharacterized protein DUF4390